MQFYVATGRRRAEIISLRGNSIEIKDGRFLIEAKVKGGFFRNFELDDETTQNALFDYLAATNRTDIFGKDEPLWLRHDKGANSNRGSNKKKGLTSHGFVRRMEIYALEAGISHFHNHRLRHTVAKIVSEYSESMAETQEALGHSTSKSHKSMCRDSLFKKINTQNPFRML